MTSGYWLLFGATHAGKSQSCQSTLHGRPVVSGGLMQVVTRFFHFRPLQKDSLLVEVHSIVTNCIAENSADVLESCGIVRILYRGEKFEM